MTAPLLTMHLTCLLCGAQAADVPSLQPGSDLHHLQAHLMDAHGVPQADWQTPGRMITQETARADGARIVIWRRSAEGRACLRAMQADAEAPVCRDVVYAPQELLWAAWEHQTDLVHLSRPDASARATLCRAPVTPHALDRFPRPQPYLASTDLCARCVDIACHEYLARRIAAAVQPDLAEAAQSLIGAGPQPLAALRYAHALRRWLDASFQSQGQRSAVSVLLAPDSARITVSLAPGRGPRALFVTLGETPLGITGRGTWRVIGQEAGWTLRADIPGGALNWTTDAASVAATVIAGALDR